MTHPQTSIRSSQRSSCLVSAMPRPQHFTCLALLLCLTTISLFIPPTASQICESDAAMRPLELTDELAVLAGDAIDLRIPVNGTTYYLQPVLSNAANYNPCTPIPLSTTTIPSKFTQFVVVPVAVMDPQLTNVAYDSNLQQDPTLPSSYAPTPVTTRPTLVSTTQLVHAPSGRLLGTSRCTGTYTPCQPHQPLLLPSSFDGQQCELSLNDFETVWDLDQHEIPSAPLLAKLLTSYERSAVAPDDDTSETANGVEKSAGNNSTMDFPHYSRVGSNVVSHDGFRPFGLDGLADWHVNDEQASRSFPMKPKRRVEGISATKQRSDDQNAAFSQKTGPADNTPSYFASYYSHLNGKINKDNHKPEHLLSQIKDQYSNLGAGHNDGDELGEFVHHSAQPSQNSNKNNDVLNIPPTISNPTPTQYGYSHKTGPYTTPSNKWSQQQQLFIDHINLLKIPIKAQLFNRTYHLHPDHHPIRPVATNTTHEASSHINEAANTNNTPSPTLLIIPTQRSSASTPSTPQLHALPESINPTTLSIFNALHILDGHLKTNLKTIFDHKKRHHHDSTYATLQSTSSSIPDVDVGAYVGNFQSAPSLFTDMINGDLSAIPMMGGSDSDNPLGVIAQMTDQQVGGIFGKIPSLGVNSGIAPPTGLLGPNNGLSGPPSPQSVVEQLQIDKFNTAQKINLERQMFVNPTVTNMQQNNINPGTQKILPDEKPHTAFVTLRTRPQSTVTTATQSLVTPCRGYVRAQTMVELDPLSERSRYGGQTQNNGVAINPRGDNGRGGTGSNFVLFGFSETGSESAGAASASSTASLTNRHMRSSGLVVEYNKLIVDNPKNNDDTSKKTVAVDPVVLLTLQCYDVITLYSQDHLTQLIVPPQFSQIELKVHSALGSAPLSTLLLDGMAPGDINLLNNLHTTLDLVLTHGDLLQCNIDPNLQSHLNTTIKYLIPTIYAIQSDLGRDLAVDHYEVAIVNSVLNVLALALTNMIAHNKELLRTQSSQGIPLRVDSNEFKTKSQRREQLHKHFISTRLGKNLSTPPSNSQSGHDPTNGIKEKKTLQQSDDDVAQIESILDQIYNDKSNGPTDSSPDTTKKNKKNQNKKGNRKSSKQTKVPITFTGQFDLNSLYSNGKSVVDDVMRYHESIHDVEELTNRFVKDHAALTQGYFNRQKIQHQHQNNNRDDDNSSLFVDYDDLDYISPPREPESGSARISYPRDGYVNRRVGSPRLAKKTTSLHSNQYFNHQINHASRYHRTSPLSSKEVRFEFNHLLNSIQSNLYSYQNQLKQHHHQEKSHFSSSESQNNHTAYPNRPFSTFQSTPATNSSTLAKSLLQSCTLTIETKTLVPICLPSTSTYPAPVNITQTLETASLNVTTSSSGQAETNEGGGLSDQTLEEPEGEESAVDPQQFTLRAATTPQSDLLTPNTALKDSEETSTVVEEVPNPVQHATTLAYQRNNKPNHRNHRHRDPHPIRNPFTRTFLPLQILDDDLDWDGNDGGTGAVEIINDPNFPPLLNTGRLNLDNGFITPPTQPLTGLDSFQSELQSNTFQQPMFALSKASGGGAKDVNCKGCEDNPGLATPMNNNFWVSESMSNLDYSMDYATLNTYPFVIGQQMIRNYGPNEQFTAIRAAKRLFMSFTFRFGIGVTFALGFVPAGLPIISTAPLAAVINVIIQPIANIIQNLPIQLPTINPNTTIQFQGLNVRGLMNWGIQRLITEDHEIVVSVILASSPGMALVSRLVAHVGRSSVPFDLAVTRRVFVPAGVYGSTDGALIEYDYKVPGVYEGANLSNLEYIADVM